MIAEQRADCILGICLLLIVIGALLFFICLILNISKIISDDFIFYMFISLLSIFPICMILIFINFLFK